jgi:predicted nuclease with TOPRIM domain
MVRLALAGSTPGRLDASKVSVGEHESILVLRQMVSDWQEEIAVRDERLAEQLTELAAKDVEMYELRKRIAELEAEVERLKKMANKMPGALPLAAIAADLPGFQEDIDRLSEYPEE